MSCHSSEPAQFNPNRKGGKDFTGKPQLQSCAAMVLMTLLYAARVARFDLFKAINFLAKRITKWDAKCDSRLHQLMSYIKSTVDEVMLGYICADDNPKDLSLHLYVDADFAGCPYTLKSTSGIHLDLEGGNSRFPWAVLIVK